MLSRRAIVTATGGPEVFAIVDEAPPAPKANEVRIPVAVAGVAFGDVMRRRGVFAPRVPAAFGALASVRTATARLVVVVAVVG